MKIPMFLTIFVMMTPGMSVAQTRTVRDTATAYGARLNAKGQPANADGNRIEDRIDNRIALRIALRIERYRPSSNNDPAAAFRGAQNDKSRVVPVITATPQQFEP